MTSNQLGLTHAAVANVLNNRADSYQIVTCLYRELTRQSATLDPSLHAWLMFLAPIEVVTALEQFPVQQAAAERNAVLLKAVRFMLSEGASLPAGLTLGQLEDRALASVNSLTAELADLKAAYSSLSSNS